MTPALRRLVAIAAVVLPCVALAGAARARAETAPATAADSVAVVRTAERFHDALARGDSALAIRLLAPDAIILESGDVESLAEYRAHHLAADIEFARSVKGTRTTGRVTVRGDAGWVAGTSTARGTFRGRRVSSNGAELMVMTRHPDGWRISAVHWSSH